ncbi:unnamed protein product [Acanthoscelides obtectus]|uniref:PiggyBac transposable element-derived protein domain-containing protein n=1 Tax=Acanthoscelides obtectus TaxID=200917 RepID=A0A9P0KAQ8_ACAOB|nr:unnamed protein product [Acanthoscelides obtectus]CAK1654274.1 PiggyBac transposable element-derived protein 4 [Acanthoscelides obtectus]
MSENRKKLTDKELEYYANHLSEISDGSVDFDSDDSIADPDFCSGSEISSEQSESDQEIDSDSDDRFTGTQGTLIPIEGKDVRDIYRLFLTDEIIQLMVQQTNVRAREIIANKKPRTSSRFSRWHDTNEDEMELFIGVIMLMGVINFPTIESYWKKDPIYYHEIFHKIPISYNRFTLLLKCWHFQDNTLPSTSRLDKINPILSIIQNNIKTVYCPGDTVVVDETMVPFRGRLKFRQYNPSKARCSYGIKLYKVCTPNGYTWHLKIYDGVSTAIDGLDLPGSTVVN